MTQARSRGRRPTADTPDPLLGFALRARIAASVGNVQYDALRASLAELVGAQNLQLNGGWTPEPSFVVHRGGRAVHEADRRAVAAWAATRRELVDYTVGPLAAASGAR